MQLGAELDATAQVLLCRDQVGGVGCYLSHGVEQTVSLRVHGAKVFSDGKPSSRVSRGKECFGLGEGTLSVVDGPSRPPSCPPPVLLTFTKLLGVLQLDQFKDSTARLQSLIHKQSRTFQDLNY